MRYFQTFILALIGSGLFLFSYNTAHARQDTSLNQKEDSFKKASQIDRSDLLLPDLDTMTYNEIIAQVDTASSSAPVISDNTDLNKKVIGKIKNHFNQDETVPTYFNYASWSNRILLLLFCILYFYWLYRLNKKEPDANIYNKTLTVTKPIWHQVIKASILFLILLPFVSLVMPLLIIQYSYLLIILLLLILLHSQISLSELRSMTAVFIFYCLLLLSNVLISTDVVTRIFGGFINIVGILLLLKIHKGLALQTQEKKLYIYAIWGIILAHSLALICILFGYIDYSRIYTTVAGVGLMQAIALKALRNIVAKDLELQFNNAPRLHTLNNFSLNKVLLVFDKLLKICFTALVFIILFNILGVIGEVIEIVKNIFNKQHHLGSISYNYADLILAIFILWLSNWLQKNLKNVLDDSPNKGRQVAKMTLFPLFRLSIIIVGFLFAINILGLGVDKLTVIIGALSVGVGLGLQNIINNFVSGVSWSLKNRLKLETI